MGVCGIPLYAVGTISRDPEWAVNAGRCQDWARQPVPMGVHDARMSSRAVRLGLGSIAFPREKRRSSFEVSVTG